VSLMPILMPIVWFRTGVRTVGDSAVQLRALCVLAQDRRPAPGRPVPGSSVRPPRRTPRSRFPGVQPAASPRRVDPSGVKATRFPGRPVGRVRKCTPEFWGLAGNYHQVAGSVMGRRWHRCRIIDRAADRLGLTTGVVAGGPGSGCPQLDRWGSQAASPMTTLVSRWCTPGVSSGKR